MLVNAGRCSSLFTHCNQLVGGCTLRGIEIGERLSEKTNDVGARASLSNGHGAHLVRKMEANNCRGG